MTTINDTSKDFGSTSNKAMKTEAYLKAEEYRDALNSGREKIEADDLSCVVYLYTSEQGRSCLVAYRGRSKKAELHYAYTSTEKRDARVAEWMSLASARKQKKVQAKTFQRTLQAGDILSASWGWEQTNINYYLVVGLVGKQSVKLIEVGALREHCSDMSGTCVPDASNKIGEVFTKRVSKSDGESVMIESYIYAFPTQKIENEQGIDIYQPAYWSSYA